MIHRDPKFRILKFRINESILCHNDPSINESIFLKLIIYPAPREREVVRVQIRIERDGVSFKIREVVVVRVIIWCRILCDGPIRVLVRISVAIPTLVVTAGTTPVRIVTKPVMVVHCPSRRMLSNTTPKTPCNMDSKKITRSVVSQRTIIP